VVSKEQIERYFRMSQVDLVTECARLHTMIEAVATTISGEFPSTAATLRQELSDGAIFAASSPQERLS
jgi:hypothetical protein